VRVITSGKMRQMGYITQKEMRSACRTDWETCKEEADLEI
jgi:hypothetical protein